MRLLSVIERATPVEDPAVRYGSCKTLVCWDIDNCPIPDGFDPGSVGPRIKLALRKLGYVGPVTIRALGNLHLVPEETLKKLSSSGIVLRHGRLPDLQCLRMECPRWRKENKGDVSIMVITDELGVKHLSESLARMKANILLAYPTTTTTPPRRSERLEVSAEWDWNKLLNDETITKPPLVEERDHTYAMLWCEQCKLSCKSFDDFANHLRLEEHSESESRVVKHSINSLFDSGSCKTLVCWEMENCPIPNGFDPVLVGPRIKSALRKLGYAGPVTIRAFGNLHLIPEETLEKLYSSGIALRHKQCRHLLRVWLECVEWREENKGDVSIMLITDEGCGKFMSEKLGDKKANLLLAYPITDSPRLDKELVVSTEWDWNELLLNDDTITKPTDDDDDTYAMLWCGECESNCKSFDDFAIHLMAERLWSAEKPAMKTDPEESEAEGKLAETSEREWSGSSDRRNREDKDGHGYERDSYDLLERSHRDDRDIGRERERDHHRRSRDRERERDHHDDEWNRGHSKSRLSQEDNHRSRSRDDADYGKRRRRLTAE